MAQHEQGGTTPQHPPRCITCGAALHPERARKYSYCMSRECQEKNAKGLAMVAVGMNKAAEEFLILDENTQADLASGKYRDQRRTSFGTSAGATPRPGAGSGKDQAGEPAAMPSGRSAAASRLSSGNQPRPARGRARPRPVRAPAKPWTPKQERLALLYNEQGLRPAEIADKLGLSSYLVTQIILATRNRGKL